MVEHRSVSLRVLLSERILEYTGCSIISGITAGRNRFHVVKRNSEIFFIKASVLVKISNLKIYRVQLSLVY